MEANQLLLRKLLTIVVVMFGFGFLMVPFYEKICEVTGVNRIGEAAEVSNTQVDTSRTVTIDFDANIRKLPWQFRPLQREVKVHPGELVQVAFEVLNEEGRPVVGQAVPSYGPQLAGQYVKKLDCFCFTRQVLQPNEHRKMQVVFVVDPTIPRDVDRFTLSYTFFELEGNKDETRS